MTDTKVAEISDKVRSGSVRGAADELAAWLERHPGDDVARMLYGTCAQLLGDTETFLRIHDELAPRMTSAPAGMPPARATLWEKYRALAGKLALPCAMVASSVILCGCYGCPPMDPDARPPRDARVAPVAPAPGAEKDGGASHGGAPVSGAQDGRDAGGDVATAPAP